MSTLVDDKAGTTARETLKSDQAWQPIRYSSSSHLANAIRPVEQENPVRMGCKAPRGREVDPKTTVGTEAYASISIRMDTISHLIYMI